MPSCMWPTSGEARRLEIIVTKPFPGEGYFYQPRQHHRQQSTPLVWVHRPRLSDDGAARNAAHTGRLGLTIVAISLGFVMVQLDVSILDIALARIGEAVAIGVTGLQWVVDTYTITFASLVLAAGALGERLGARRVYVSGFVLFVLASLGCGSRQEPGC